MTAGPAAGVDLCGALAAVASREPWMALRSDVPDDRDWVRADVLLAPGGLRPLVAQGAQVLATSHPTASEAVRRRVAAALLLGDWSWALGVAGAATYAECGRVPDLAPSLVGLRVTGARVSGVAVTGGWASGPATDAALRAQLGAHLSLLHARLREGPAPLLRRGPRACWTAAADGVVLALTAQAEAQTGVRREQVLATAARLVDGAPAGWGRPVVGGLRASCCLWYRLPGEQDCATCPRRR